MGNRFLIIRTRKGARKETMLHITELKNNKAVYDQAKKFGLLNKKWFVFNSFTDELIGAFDDFDKAMNANQQ